MCIISMFNSGKPQMDADAEADAVRCKLAEVAVYRDISEPNNFIYSHHVGRSVCNHLAKSGITMPPRTQP